MHVRKPVQWPSLIVLTGRLKPATLTPRANRIRIALEPAFAQQLSTLPRRERPARFDALPQETQSHIDHAISVAAHGTCNAYRADRRCQFDSAQRVRASSDAMFRRRHVDDVQRLSNHRLPLMVEVGDIRHAAQSRTAGADTQHVHQRRMHATGSPRHGRRSIQPAPECDRGILDVLHVVEHRQSDWRRRGWKVDASRLTASVMRGRVQELMQRIQP